MCAAAHARHRPSCPTPPAVRVPPAELRPISWTTSFQPDLPCQPSNRHHLGLGMYPGRLSSRADSPADISPNGPPNVRRRGSGRRRGDQRLRTLNRFADQARPDWRFLIMVSKAEVARGYCSAYSQHDVIGSEPVLDDRHRLLGEIVKEYDGKPIPGARAAHVEHVS